MAESAKANLAPFGWHSSGLTLAKLRPESRAED
jgi:hypothetical protein